MCMSRRGYSHPVCSTGMKHTYVEPLNVGNQHIMLPGDAGDVFFGCDEVLPEGLCLPTLLPGDALLP